MHGLCRVDLEFPKIEVRFQNLSIETFVHVGSRALPTIPNFVCNMTEVIFPLHPLIWIIFWTLRFNHFSCVLFLFGHSFLILTSVLRLGSLKTATDIQKKEK